jgi:hypothetical protein
LRLSKAGHGHVHGPDELLTGISGAAAYLRYLRSKNRVVNQLYFDMGRWVRFMGTVHSAAYLATDATPDDECYVMDQYHPWIWIPAPVGGLIDP